MLNHPMLKPLADLVQREMDVMRAARRALELHGERDVPHEQVVVALLELRSALSTWNGADAWKVRSLYILRKGSCYVSWPP